MMPSMIIGVTALAAGLAFSGTAQAESKYQVFTGNGVAPVIIVDTETGRSWRLTNDEEPVWAPITYESVIGVGNKIFTFEAPPSSIRTVRSIRQELNQQRKLSPRRELQLYEDHELLVDTSRGNPLRREPQE